MKRLFFSLICIFASTVLLAQSPDLFNYQGVARDLSGVPLQNKNIGLRISILRDTPTGSEVFKELHLIRTNNLGLFNIQIGSGTSVMGSIGGIDWGNGSYYLKIELDEDGGSNYKLMGTSQLISVPYALYAKNAASVDYNNLTNRPQGENPGDMLYWDDEMWVILPVGLPGQYLQLDANSRPVWAGPTYPSVSTFPVTEITNNTAVSGGLIINNGGSPIIARGICWSTNPNPTVDDAKTSTEYDEFISQMTGLTSETQYYVRAYATNSVGTGYGSQQSFSTNSSKTTPDYVPTNGLLAWWPFNGNAQDESGNGWNGTVNGAVLTTDRLGNPNAAFSFTTNQEINIPGSQSMNIFPLSISLWYKLDSVNGSGNLFSKYISASWNGFQINVDHSDTWGNIIWPWYIRDNQNRLLGMYGEDPFHQTNVETNVWYHFVFTVDDSEGKIYVNGELIDTHKWTGQAGPSSNHFLWKIGGLYNQWFHGKIDDIGLWNRVLTQEEISAIYKSEQYIAQPDPITDSRDGKKYETVRIGNQIWMAENLSYLPAVSPPSIGSTTDPHYYVYDYIGTNVSAAKSTHNYTTYGVLYNWPAAMAGASSSNTNPSNVQGVCPAGWHIPSDAEWMQLANYLADNGYNFDGTIGGGRDKIAKSLASKVLWHSSSITGAVGNNLSENNKSGFNGLPAGIRASDATFYRLTFNGHWWSSTQSENASSAYHWLLGSDDVGLLRLQNSNIYGHSVRCVKDQ